VSATQPGQDFGANDWLVEEMYERYQQRQVRQQLVQQQHLPLEHQKVELHQFQNLHKLRVQHLLQRNQLHQ